MTAFPSVDVLSSKVLGFKYRHCPTWLTLFYLNKLLRNRLNLLEHTL